MLMHDEFASERLTPPVGKFTVLLFGTYVSDTCGVIKRSTMNPLHASFSGGAGSGQLGPLEKTVLQAVWARGTATVREVREDGAIWQTYPTIMTTMDRLFKKGILDRAPDGRAFRYTARHTPEELERLTAVNGMRRLLESEYASLHLSYLVEAVGAQDGKLLDELQSLVERQRAQLKKGEQE